jgi:hypothetical protein
MLTQLARSARCERLTVGAEKVKDVAEETQGLLPVHGAGGACRTAGLLQAAHRSASALVAVTSATPVVIVVAVLAACVGRLHSGKGRRGGEGRRPAGTHTHTHPR